MPKKVKIEFIGGPHDGRLFDKDILESKYKELALFVQIPSDTILNVQHVYELRDGKYYFLLSEVK